MFETDKTLVKRFVNGDEDAFTLLATKWLDHILNFAYRFLGDEVGKWKLRISTIFTILQDTFK